MFVKHERQRTSFAQRRLLDSYHQFWVSTWHAENHPNCFCKHIYWTAYNVYYLMKSILLLLFYRVSVKAHRHVPLIVRYPTSSVVSCMDVAKLTTLKYKKVVTAIPLVWLPPFKWLSFHSDNPQSFCSSDKQRLRERPWSYQRKGYLKSWSSCRFKDCTTPMVMLACQINCKADHTNSTSVYTYFVFFDFCFVFCTPVPKWAANHCQQKLQWCDIILLWEIILYWLLQQVW